MLTGSTRAIKIHRVTSKSVLFSTTPTNIIFACDARRRGGEFERWVIKMRSPQKNLSRHPTSSANAHLGLPCALVCDERAERLGILRRRPACVRREMRQRNAERANPRANPPATSRDLQSAHSRHPCFSRSSPCGEEREILVFTLSLVFLEILFVLTVKFFCI